MANASTERVLWADDVDDESESQKAYDSTLNFPLDEEGSPEEPQTTDASVLAEVISTNPQTSTQFNLDTFKTEKCTLSVYHFPCPYYHSERDRRRPQSQYSYHYLPCKYIKRGKEWGDPRLCRKGDQCSFAHSLAEVKYHTELYHSQKCQKEQCEWGEMCAYRHEPKTPTPEHTEPEVPASSADQSQPVEAPIGSVSPSQLTSEEHDVPQATSTMETFLEMYTSKFRLCDQKVKELKTLEDEIEKLDKELRSLTEAQKCRKCRQQCVSMAAVECGHLVCIQCGSEAVTRCPFCFKPSFLLSLQSNSISI